MSTDTTKRPREVIFETNPPIKKKKNYVSKWITLEMYIPEYSETLSVNTEITTEFLNQIQPQIEEWCGYKIDERHQEVIVDMEKRVKELATKMEFYETKMTHDLLTIQELKASNETLTKENEKLENKLASQQQVNTNILMEEFEQLDVLKARVEKSEQEATELKIILAAYKTAENMGCTISNEKDVVYVWPSDAVKSYPSLELRRKIINILKTPMSIEQLHQQYRLKRYSEKELEHELYHMVNDGCLKRPIRRDNIWFFEGC